MQKVSRKASTESFRRVGEMMDVCPRWSQKSSTESFERVREMTFTPQRDVSEIVDGIFWTCERDDGSSSLWGIKSEYITVKWMTQHFTEC